MTAKTRNLGEKIDRLIGTWLPGVGLKRMQDRESMATGGYAAGSTSSAIFQEYLTTITDADSSIIWDRNRIVARSRDNVRNIPIATGLIKRICDHSIGDRGLALHSQVDRKFLGWELDQAKDWQMQAEGLWRTFSDSKESDFNREQTVPEKTYLTLKSELEGGDCFTIFTELARPGSSFKLKLQSIEGEFVSNPNSKQNTNLLVDGFQKNENGQVVFNWFSKFHPGDRINYSQNVWNARRVFDANGRRNILHHFDKIRFGQTRGIPVLGPCTGKLVQLNRLSDAELMASVINSYYTLVVQGNVADTAPQKKNPNETNTTLSSDDKLTLGSATIIRAKPGTKIESFDPKRPNLDYIKFFESMVAEIGASVGVPKSLILQIFDKSYSASRGEVLLGWVYFLSKRTHIAVNFCQPTYEAVMDEAVQSGKIQAAGYLTNSETRQAYLGSAYQQWTGPTRPAIDELKEAKAFETYLSIGTKSRQEITAETTGKNWIQVNDQLSREHDLRVKAGLEETIEEGIDINQLINSGDE